MMFSPGYMAWMAGQVLSAVTSIWQVSVPLLAILAAACVHFFLVRKKRLQRKFLLLFLPFLPMLLMLFLGALLNYDLRDRSPGLYGIALPLVEGLAVVQLLMNIGLVIISKGFRWIAASAGLVEIWTGLWCSAVAGMSISGVWL